MIKRGTGRPVLTHLHTHKFSAVLRAIDPAASVPLILSNFVLLQSISLLYSDMGS
jgi:hypothetical protein